jgi:hypothetical protein
MTHRATTKTTTNGFLEKQCVDSKPLESRMKSTDKALLDA